MNHGPTIPAPEESDNSKADARRPMEYCADVARAICAHVSIGWGLNALCKQPGFPARARVIKWLDDNPEFRAAFETARKHQADYLDEEMQREANSADPITCRVAELRIKTMQWRAARLNAARYGDRQAVDLSGNVTLNLGARLDAATAQIENRAPLLIQRNKTDE